MTQWEAFFARLNRSGIVRLAFSSGLLRATSLALTTLTSIALARILGPASFGNYSYALALVAVIGLPLHMGLPTLVLRETAKGEAEAAWGKVRALWHWAGRRIGRAAVLTFAFGLPFLYFFGDRLINSSALAIIWISLLLVPLLAVAHVRGAAVRGLQRPILGSLPDAIIRPALLLVLLLGLTAGFQTRAPEVAMALHVIAATASALLGIAMLYWLTPREVRDAELDVTAVPQWTRSLKPLALLAGTQVLMQNANILILGLWVSPDQIGYFKIAVSAVALAAIGLTAIDMIIAPKFARLYAQGELHALEREASKAALLSFAAAIPVTTLFLVFGQQIISLLYGGDFQPAYWPLIIMLIGQLVNAFCGSSGHLLNMSGNEIGSLRTVIIATILNLVLLMLLVPQMGIEGAAIATSLSLALLNILNARIIRRKLNISSTPLTFLNK